LTTRRRLSNLPTRRTTARRPPLRSRLEEGEAMCTKAFASTIHDVHRALVTRLDDAEGKSV
jgi:hypothetical protein